MWNTLTPYHTFPIQILKYTPESHPDQQQLVDALDLCQELCSQVNEGVREKENSDRLEWIQQHVQCDGLPEVNRCIPINQTCRRLFDLLMRNIRYN